MMNLEVRPTRGRGTVAQEKRMKEQEWMSR